MPGAGPLGVGPDGEVLLRVKVVPGASTDEVVGAFGACLKVRVRAAPERGRANGAVLGLLAERLALSPRALRLVSGPVAPLKVVGVRGLPLPQVAARLGLSPSP